MNCPCCGHTLVEDAAFCPWCDTPLPNAPHYDDYAYEAFISYRHLPLDHQVAERVQRSVEGFVIPKPLRARAGRSRIGKLFRDEDELPTASSLPDQIGDALKRSRMLIVICSPKTRESAWVQREVELFASYHGRNRIRIALAAGEPDESFPELLLHRTIVAEDGSVTQVEEEPLAADFRDLSRKHVATERLRIEASLIGCGYDDLRHRMRARRQRLVLAASALISVVSLAFGSFALWQRVQIRENLRQAQIEESELLAEKSLDLYEQGDRAQALAVAISALPTGSASGDRPFVPAARMALERAMNLYPSSSGTFAWTSSCMLRGFEEASTAYSDGGNIAALDAVGTLHVFDSNGEEVQTIEDVEPAHKASEKDTFTAAPLLHFIGLKLLYVSNDVLALYDLEAGTQVWTREIENCNSNCAIAVSANREHVTLTVEGETPNTQRTIVASVASGAIEDEFTLDCPSVEFDKDILFFENPCAAFSDDGSRLAVGINGRVFAIDLATREVLQAKLAHDVVVDLRFCDEGLLAMSEEALYQNAEDRFAQLATVQLLDNELQERWSYAATEHIRLNATGEYLNSTVGLYGHLASSVRPEGQELVLVRNGAVVLNMQTGEETWHYESSDSVLDCFHVKDKTWFFLATTSGDVLYFDIEGESTVSDGFPGLDVELGEATGAHFFGGSLALWSEDPSRCRIYTNNGKGHLLTYNAVRQTYDLAPEVTDAPPYSEYALLTAEGICLLDAESLDVTRTVALEALPNLQNGSQLGLYRRGSGTLYAFGPEESAEQSSVYALSPEGEREDRTLTLEGMVLDPHDRTALKEYEEPEGVPLLLVHDLATIALVDPATGTTLLRIDCDEQVNDCWYAQGKIIASLGFARSYDSHTRWALKHWRHVSFVTSGTSLKTFDATDGHELAAPWDGVRPWASLASCVFVDESGSRLALACDDGRVRLYDLAASSLVWESSLVASGLLSIYADATTGNVLAQDDAGRLCLLSARDGSLVKTSTTQLEGIVSYRPTQDAAIVEATYQSNDMMDSRGIVVISLDPTCFGPTSEIPGGLFRSRSAMLVALKPKLEQTVYSALCLSLDQELEHARIHLRACPVTDYERQMYGIE